MKDRQPVDRAVWVIMPVILVMWGSFAAVSKLTMKDMDSFQLQFWMFFAGAAALALYLAARRKLGALLRLRLRDVLFALLCGLPSYLYYFFYTLSLHSIPAVEASMLNYLFPVMIVLFAVPINGERLTVRSVLSVLLGFAGAAVVITGGKLSGLRLTNIAGDLLALGGAVCWGVFSALGRRNRLDAEVSAFLYVLLSFALSAVSLFCFSGFRLPAPAEAAGALWLALSNVLTLPLWLRVLKSAPAALVASVTFVTPFVTLLFIMLLLGETLNLTHAAGLAVIAASIAVQTIRLPAMKQKTKESGPAL